MLVYKLKWTIKLLIILSPLKILYLTRILHKFLEQPYLDAKTNFERLFVCLQEFYLIAFESHAYNYVCRPQGYAVKPPILFRTLLYTVYIRIC